MKEDLPEVSMKDMLDHEPSDKAIKEEELITNSLALYLAQSYDQLAREPLDVDPLKVAKRIRSIVRPSPGGAYMSVPDAILIPLIQAILRFSEAHYAFEGTDPDVS
jgi:hypothetical protein